MQNIAQLLEKKYKTELRYFRAVEVIQKNWPDIVNELSRFITPKNIYKNQLIIECNNPVWMSEIDCFKLKIVEKVNQALKKSRINVVIIDVKPLFNSELIIKSKTLKKNPPIDIQDRIRWNLENKKKDGAQLCQKCEKIWDNFKTCRLCRLTV